MKTLQLLYEFFFHRWKSEVIEEGKDSFKRAKTYQEFVTTIEWPTYVKNDKGNFISKQDDGFMHYTSQFIKYKLTNKFNGSVKIKKKYID